MGEGEEERVYLIAHYLEADILLSIDLHAVLVKFLQYSTEFLVYVSCEERKGYEIFVSIK